MSSTANGPDARGSDAPGSPAPRGEKGTRLADQAVDYAVSSWLAVGVGVTLGCTVSWLLWFPCLALSLWLGWRFIDRLVWISLSLSGSTDGAGQ